MTALAIISHPDSDFTKARTEAADVTTLTLAADYITFAIAKAERAASLLNTAAGLPEARDRTKVEALRSLDAAIAQLAEVRREFRPA